MTKRKHNRPKLEDITLVGETFMSLEMLGYPLHYISNFGRVFSKSRTGGLRTPWVSTQGYHNYSFKYKKGVRKTFRTNQLVAMAFIPNPNNYPVVNHIDHDKKNNHVSNLEWCTQSHNIKEAYKRPHKSNGIKGEKNKFSKLKEYQVVNIRRDHATGKFTGSKLAKLYKTSEANISDIVRNNTWRHLISERI